MTKRFTAFRRVYRLKAATGLLLVLPGLLWGLWLAWTVHTEQSHFQAYLTSGQPVDSTLNALDPELYQIKVHDLLVRQLRSLNRGQVASASTPSASTPSALPLFDLSLQPDRLTKLLNADKHPYVQGKLDYAGQRYKKTELRLRGRKYWHLHEAKKSLRVKLDKGRLIQGWRVFDLNNPNDPLPIGAKLFFDLAVTQGLMATAADFARVRLNGFDLGVYALGTPVDEIVLRRHRLIPANIYQLDDLKANDSSPARWERVSAYQRKDLPGSEDIRQDLSSLIQNLKADSTQFANFAAESLHLKDFATLDALQMLMGRDPKQRGYALTFDPYRGQWRPILTAAEVFRSDKPDAIQPDPLLRRLAELPRYTQLRLQILTELMNGPASPAALSLAGQSHLTRLKPALAQDLNWKANKQLPDFDARYVQLMRPMTLEALQLAFDVELETYARRFAALSQQISAVPLQHPSAPLPLKPEKVLGPGILAMTGTQVFASDQTVLIQPGTRLMMAPGASLIFHGRVRFAGTASAPIQIQSATATRWGGLVIQGPASHGSQLSHVRASGGSQPQWQANQYPGMINVHDTATLTIQDSRFEDNARGDDLIHMAYVDGFQVNNTQVHSAASDAWDIEFSRGRLDRLQVLRTGDDGIDLMGSQVSISDSLISACQGNGISAGEESTVQVNNSLIAHCGQGALAKNVSTLRLSRSLLYQNRTGLAFHQESSHYTGLSSISTESVFESGSKTLLKLDEASKHLEKPRLLKLGQAARELDPLRQGLGLKDWDMLPAWLAERGGQL